MTRPLPGDVVSNKWLHDCLDDDDLVVLDASVPPVSGEVRSDLKSLRIRGARYFDLNGKFSDKASDLPHMMPPSDQFEEEAQLLGINAQSTVVIYDNLGVYSSPRAWWMFKSMGHPKVAVLNGGLPAWVDASLPVETIEDRSIPRGNFRAEFDPSFFKDSASIVNQLGQTNQVVIDARSEGRFCGTSPEPRANLRGGHIPGSKNLPFTELIREFELKESGELSTTFEKLANPDQEVTFSCGSGLTACILALGACQAGFRKISIYDGSWSEWGRPSDLPVEK